MSHETEIESKLSKLIHIKKGLTKLNMKFKVAEEGKKLRTENHYGNSTSEVDIIITEIDGKSTRNTVGLQKATDGTYNVVGDFWDFRNKWNEKSLRNELTVAASKSEIDVRMKKLGFKMKTTKRKNKVEVVQYEKF